MVLVVVVVMVLVVVMIVVMVLVMIVVMIVVVVVVADGGHVLGRGGAQQAGGVVREPAQRVQHQQVGGDGHGIESAEYMHAQACTHVGRETGREAKCSRDKRGRSHECSPGKEQI
jgi:hypothetical protein